ncbi:MAG: C45 family autoproteolytic acyltransferase/hydrolase [bacterium]|nr:C45 family autoproteolytic acyltransferase/hydrolase [bacterium]
MAALPYLEVTGSPRERGRAHGEAFRETIRTLLDAHFEDLENGVEPLTKARAIEISGSYLEPAENYAPDLVAEARGIAEGADAPFEEILALNAFLDLYDHLSNAFIKGGCTTLMAPGEIDGTGAVIGQNYDLHTIFAPAAVVIKIVGEACPDALVYTSAGMLGCAGLNSEGIGVVINNLVPADSGPGVPYPFVIRGILASERIGDAIDAVVANPRASGMNYVLCDRNGEIYDLETTAREYEVTCPFEGPMAHTNHYLADRLKPLERRQWNQRGQSILRWGRATRRLLACERADAAAFREILTDKVNYPVGICRSNEVLGEGACGQTICGIVIEPPEGRIWMTRGPTGEYEWAEYRLFESVEAAREAVV